MIKQIHTFKFKLILFCIIIISIVFILQVGVSQFIIKSIIVNKSHAYFQETIDQIGKRTDLQIEQCHESVYMIADNQVIKNYMRDLQDFKINYNIAKYKIMREILNLLNLKNIESIHIFMNEYPPINCYYSIAIMETDEYTQYLLSDSFKDIPRKIYLGDLQKEPFQIPVFLCIRDGTKKLGVLQVNFNESFLSKILDEVELGKEGKVYLVSNDHIVFTKERSLIEEPFSILNINSDSTVKYPLKYNNWELTGVIPKAEISNQIFKINQIFFLVIILIFAAILFFISFAIRAILRPLNKVMKGMESIQQGNLNIILETDETDEFSVIIHNFNYMVERIKSLIDTTYHQQMLYRKAEMAALQAKLNPHFLYNTLDMIYWMLILRSQEEIGNAVVALSNILRYSISKEDEFVTVKEDMEQLKNYLEILRMRFDGKLIYTFHIQEDILELKIPKLLIQPLIENSIKYAFQDMNLNGEINIVGFTENEDIVFIVADNGTGIPIEKIQMIVSSCEYQNKKSGIGIKMVDNRIKYIYGEGYGISIESELGEGTKIKVRLGKKDDLIQEKS